MTVTINNQPSGGLLNGITKRGLSTTFSPSDIPDLEIWLDSDDVTYNGSNEVTSWNDKSGNGRDATTVNNPSTPPTYVASHPGFGGAPAIDMTGGVNERLEFTGLNISSTEYTFIFVIDPDAGYANQYLWDSKSNRFVIAWSDSTNTTSYFDAGGFQGQSTRSSLPQILTFVLNESTNTGEIYENGVLVATDTFSGRTISNATGLGGRPLGSGGGNGFNGYMGAFLLYSRALTTIEREQIEGNLTFS